ncbi:hypothetical protein [Streptomyces sp. NPDC052225]|uniref:hypothetical protein n=1 Tax=Streptomyces sp. NPDC052225 TaxID=3154949 RepID=UPI00341EF0CE
MRRPVITGVLVVALAAGGAAFRPVEPAPEIRALAAPAAESARPVADDAAPKPADQVRGERLLKKAGALLADAESVRMKAEVRQGAKHVRTDIRMDHDGNCAGTVDDGAGVTADVIYLVADKEEGEGDAYLKYPDSALAALQVKAEARGPEVAARMREFVVRIRGKYVKAPDGPKGAQAVGKQCTLGRTLAQGMTGEAEGTRARPVVRRDGTRMVPLLPPKDGADDGTGTAYVEADGDPYLRSLNGTSGTMRIDIDFSAYDAPLTVRRPDPSQVVEVPRGDGSVFEV